MTRFILTSAALFALATSSHAFTVSPSFVAPRQQLPATYTHGSNLVNSTPSRASSSSALQMGLFDRIVRVTKANIDSVLKGLEDPELIMGQALEDMQVSFIASAKETGQCKNSFSSSFLFSVMMNL
jgi:hypothetical protein